jgi:hypothetical protein
MAATKSPIRNVKADPRRVRIAIIDTPIDRCMADIVHVERAIE